MMGGRWAGTRPSAARCSSRSRRRRPIASPGALLGLPLPWARIGGAVDEPALAHDRSAGLPLRNPIGLAAGFDKTLRAPRRARRRWVSGTWWAARSRAPPRAGNATAADRAIARDPALDGERDGPAQPRCRGRGRGTSRATRGARRAPVREHRRRGRRRRGLVASTCWRRTPTAIELNASCPNVSWGRDRDNEAHLRDAGRPRSRARTATAAVREAARRSSTGVEREVVLALARIAQEAGAPASRVRNTRLVADAAARDRRAAGCRAGAVAAHRPDRRRRCARPPAANSRSTPAAASSRPTTS